MREYILQDDSRFILEVRKDPAALYKELEREQRGSLIEFDNLSTAGAEDAFEEAVDEAASLANRFIESGYSVGIKAIGSGVPAGRGKGQLFRILNHLALIRPAEGKGAPRVRVVHQ